MKGKIKQNDLQIHDAHIDQNDNLLLLVDYKNDLDASFFWISSKQMSSARIESYSRNLEAFLHLKSTDNLACNSTKIVTLPCDKKTRTVGIFLACFNCGLIASYKVIIYSIITLLVIN